MHIGNITEFQHEVLPETSDNKDTIRFIIGFLVLKNVINILVKLDLNRKLFISQPGNHELATLIKEACRNGSAIDIITIYLI